MRWAVAALTLSFLLCAAPPPAALESDQYYRWDDRLEDVTDLLNAKAALEIDAALETINRRPSWKRMHCHQVVHKIIPRFRQLIFHEYELWVTNSSLVDRMPRTAEEETEFRRRYIYRITGPLDLGTKVPPSPTILVNGVRFGTDKLSHFFSEGHWYYKWYRRARKKGLSPHDAELRAIGKGIFAELTILGKLASGVFSVGDLEANYEGMRFLVGLCEGDSPGLEKTGDGWRQARQLDFREHVTPKWDESFLPPIFSKRRWKKVHPALLDYCPLLANDAFVRQQAVYAAQDKSTPTWNRVQELIDAGKLSDPREYTLERNCPPTDRLLDAEQRDPSGIATDQLPSAIGRSGISR